MQKTVPQLLEEIKTEFPRLRYGQIVINACLSNDVLYFFEIEDEKLIDALEEFQAKLRNHHE